MGEVRLGSRVTTMYACSSETEPKEQREALILEHLPQVRLIARRIHERLPDRVSIDDLISSGIVGLIAAIDNFDPSLNVKLKTYAEYRIRGAIIDALRDLDWAPRQKRRMSRQIEQSISVLEQRLSRTPTEEEIAAELQISLEEYHRWLVDTEGLQIADLEVAGDTEDGGFSVLRYVATPDSDSPERLLERSELERHVASAIDHIPHQERTILSLYYHEELNLREIAEILGLHLSRISQLKTQAILRLRAALEPRWPGRKEL